MDELSPAGGAPAFDEASLDAADADAATEIAAASATGRVLFARPGETTLIVPPYSRKRLQRPGHQRGVADI